VSKRDLVFLSYASEDLKQVWKVYKGLKKKKSGTVRKNVKIGGRSPWQAGLRNLDNCESG